MSYKFKKFHILIAVVAVLLIVIILKLFPGSGDMMPDKSDEISLKDGKFDYKLPLDPTSPWPKFRGNELQNGRSPVSKEFGDGSPWTYMTKKGIFSSPVVDGNGTVYVGSADKKFYALNKDGSLKWFVQTDEIIDSSALLDDRGMVYFGSGDGHVYAVDRTTGTVKWKFKSDTTDEVLKNYGIETFNLNWFEGNISMLKDGTLIAPNDNYVVYAINRDNGEKKNNYFGNEMCWSVPAVNINTGYIFFGTTNPTSKNIFKYNAETGKQEWVTGAYMAPTAATIMLTNSKEDGALVVGSFDGYVKAISQKSGDIIWKYGTNDHIYASASQMADGTIIQPSTDGTVYALNPQDGSVKWAFDTLEPIRSSAVIDGMGRIYVGSGEGRLFCINSDGTLRWAYKCIDDDRNDLNASPALGHDSVIIAGENGGIFSIPYDYPLTAAGKADPRCKLGPKEDLADEGVFMIYTTRFGGLLQGKDVPSQIDANEPVTFSLFVRKNTNTVMSMIDRDSIVVTVSGDPKVQTKVSANRRFVTIAPQETWLGQEGGAITVNIKGTYSVDLSRVGLKFFGGSKGGDIDQTYTFNIPARSGSVIPFKVPAKAGDPSMSFEFARLAAPNPTMLPSWNQIGFDSLHYISGALEGKDNKVTLWVIGGSLVDDKTIVDPANQTRYPMTLEYDSGMMTFFNYDGFKISFVGSWDMPFGSYRLSAKVDPATGDILNENRMTFCATALGDDIAFYGKGLKMTGATEWDTGHMAVYGGLNLHKWNGGYTTLPEGAGTAVFSAGETSATVDITDGKLNIKDHVYSLVLMDDATGKVFPLYYTKRTVVGATPEGIVNKVTVSYEKGEVKGKIRAYYVVDTYPAIKGDAEVK